MKDSYEIKVPGTDFIIKEDTIYTVLPKEDPNAPDGFKEHGTTKIIHPDVGTTIGAPYNSDMEVWDTGFYKYSPCLKGMGDTEKTAYLKLVDKILVKPIEEIKGEGVLNHKKTNKFLDELAIPLANKAAFNSNNPLERLGLYFAVLSKELCPKENVGNPIFSQAAYKVVNREVEITNREQIEIDNARATGEFYSLLKSDKKKLVKIFNYLRISDTAIEDEGTFMSIFTRFLKDKQDGYRNSKIFLEQLARFETDEGLEELHIFSLLNELYDKKEVTIIKSEYYLRGTVIGNSLKHAAMAAVKNPELKRLIIELSAEDEDNS